MVWMYQTPLFYAGESPDCERLARLGSAGKILSDNT
jgi:hypothetical protein